MCLQRRSLATAIPAGSTILALSQYATIYNYSHNLLTVIPAKKFVNLKGGTLEIVVIIAYIYR
jgi:hypothetical protein